MDRSRPPRARGELLALAAAMWSAVFLIPYKAAGAAAPGDAIVAAMLACAAALCTGLHVAFRLIPGLARGSAVEGRGAGAGVRAGAPGVRRRALLDRVTVWTALALAVFTVTGNVSVSQALARLDPGLTSVGLQTQVLFVAGIAHFALAERLTVRFVAGAVVALGGFAIVRAPTAGHAVPLAGILWAIGGALSFALMHVVTRRVIHRIEPLWVNALRLWLAVAAMLCLPGRAAAFVALAPRPWLYAAAAAFVGPFLGRISIMYAVRHVEASRAILLGLTAPVFAFALGFAAFGVIPRGHELLGAAVIVCGIAIPLIRVRARG